MEDVKHILLSDQNPGLDVDEYRTVTCGDGFENLKSCTNSSCTRSSSYRTVSCEEEFGMQTLAPLPLEVTQFSISYGRI